MSNTQTFAMVLFAAITLAADPTASAQTCPTERVSVDSSGGQGNGNSHVPSLSSDGRYVAFHSLATNLVPGDTNGFVDVFVHDRMTGQTTRVSVDSGGGQSNKGSARCSISEDGRFVAFDSEASNLVPGDSNASMTFFPTTARRTRRRA